MPAKPACRLEVIFARDADVAVILRRGPTRWVQVIRWDTRRDAFEDGAWFYGRIYAERCDLSPDGELLLYFAAKHNRGPTDDSYGYAWTAISRPPWLEALALWPNPCGTYGVGGHFIDNRRIAIVNVGHKLMPSPVLEPHPAHVPPRDFIIEQTDGRSFRRMGAPAEVEGADWAVHDRRGKIVFARRGKLYRRVGTNDRELMDFNERTPEPRRAPAAARRGLTERGRRG